MSAPRCSVLSLILSLLALSKTITLSTNPNYMAVLKSTHLQNMAQIDQVASSSTTPAPQPEINFDSLWDESKHHL
jgi:hypothetical protein